MHTVSPRLKRLLQRLLRYDVTLVFVPGVQMHVADALSRDFLPHQEMERKQEFEMEYLVHGIISQSPASDKRITEIREETAKDQTCKLLIDYIQNGFPDHKAQLPAEIKPMWDIQQGFSYSEGIILRGARLFIPVALRKSVLQCIHQSHMGIDKTKSRANETIYWPGMTRDIEITIKRCDTCNRFQNKQQKETLISHDIPEQAWHKLGMDIFTVEGRDYLLLIDYLSKFPIVHPLESKTAPHIIEVLKDTFSCFGIPYCVVADNMPFNSVAFKRFAEEWNFIIKTSSPRYPQSNGLVERNVQTIKKLIRKAKYTGSDYRISLLEFRNASITGMTSTPARLLMSRALRSVIPCTESSLKMRIEEGAADKLKLLQEKQALYYNRDARDLTKLDIGDTVKMLKGEQSWEPGTVKQINDMPRSYVIETNNGRQYRRNRKFIRPSIEPQHRFEMTEEATCEEIEEDQNEIISETPIQDSATVQVPTSSSGHKEAQQGKTQNSCDETLASRPKRHRQMPKYYKDYVLT